MPVHNILPGNVSLTPGYYRLTPVDSAIVFVDVDDFRRGCMLHPDGTYYLHLKTTLSRGELRPVVVNGCVGRLEISQISPALFWIKAILAVSRSHGMQRFGPGERLLLLARDQADMAEAAFECVEFRYLRQYGLDDAAVKKNGWSWIETAWPAKVAEPNPVETVASKPKTSCVYVHMHYWEIWPEIEAVLLNDCQGLDLIVTSTAERKAEFERIRMKFPDCQIIVHENRGRDVGPFLELLRKGVFDRYDSVCKIHGKISKKNGRETLSGVRIRRYILACLLADGACRRAVGIFATDQKNGLAGPANLVLPTEDEPVTRYIKNEVKHMRQVMAQAGQDFQADKVEFFAGTMFWFRPAALKNLKHMDIGIFDFEPENGAKYNTLHHAMERLFCQFTKDADFQIVKLQPMRCKVSAADQETT